MDSSSVKQSNEPKYVGHGLGGAGPNIDYSTSYYDTPEYVVDVLGGAVLKTYRRLPESRNPRLSLPGIEPATCIL